MPPLPPFVGRAAPLPTADPEDMFMDEEVDEEEPISDTSFTRPFACQPPPIAPKGWCFTPWFGARPNIALLSAVMFIAALAVVVVVITVVSEHLYAKTIDKFGRNAVESAVQRGGQLVITTYQDALIASSGVLSTTYGGSRLLPTEEERMFRELQLPVMEVPPTAGARYDWPDRAGNVSATRAVLFSTWRNFYTSIINSCSGLHDERVMRLEIVFADGTVISAVRHTTGLMDITDMIPVGDTEDVLGNLTYMGRSFRPTTSGSLLGVPVPTYTYPLSRPDPRSQGWVQMTLPSTDSLSGDSRPSGGSLLLPTEYTSHLGATTISHPIIPVVADLRVPAGVIGRVRLDYKFIAGSDLAVATLLKGIVGEMYGGSEPLVGESVAGDTFLVESGTRRILSTSMSDGDTMSQMTAKANEPTTAQLAAGCLTLTELGVPKLRCPYTVESFPYHPALAAAYTIAVAASPDIIQQQVNNEQPISSAVRAYASRIDYYSLAHEGASYYVGATQVEVAYGIVLPRLLYILPVGELSVVFADVRRTVAYIAIGTALGFALLLAVLSRLVMQPVHAIAERMTIAAALKDDDTVDAPQQGGGDKKPPTIPSVRTPSMWSEVYAIQSSYWSLTDELQALKAYIPEHLKGVIMEKGRNRERKSRYAPITVEKAPTNSSDDNLPKAAEYDGDPIPQPGAAAEVELSDIRPTADPPKEHVDEQPTAAADQLAVDEEDAVNSAAITVCHNVSPPLLASSATRTSSPLSIGSDEDRPIYFADSSLIDREITVVHLNINRFHDYVLRRRHPSRIGDDYDKFITYIHQEVKRFGGVLESFSGDKLWVSFNATTKCDHHPVAAAYFAFVVTSTINSTALQFEKCEKGAEKVAIDGRFACCEHGVSSGISTGKAFVGPFGNRAIKRHNIIGNVMPAAQALERQSRYFPGLAPLVTNGMMRELHGYFQYLIVDHSYLPGSHKRKKRNPSDPPNAARIPIAVRMPIAALQGPKDPMLAEGSDLRVVRRWLTVSRPPSDPMANVEHAVVSSEGGELTSCFDLRIEQPQRLADALYSGSRQPAPPFPLLIFPLPLVNPLTLCNDVINDAVFKDKKEPRVDRVHELVGELEKALECGPDPRYCEDTAAFAQRVACLESAERYTRHCLANESYASEWGTQYEPITAFLRSPMQRQSHVIPPPPPTDESTVV